jgi:hypothetical protein
MAYRAMMMYRSPDRIPDRQELAPALNHQSQFELQPPRTASAVDHRRVCRRLCVCVSSSLRQWMEGTDGMQDTYHHRLSRAVPPRPRDLRARAGHSTHRGMHSLEWLIPCAHVVARASRRVCCSCASGWAWLQTPSQRAGYPAVGARVSGSG